MVAVRVPRLGYIAWLASVVGATMTAERKLTKEQVEIELAVAKSGWGACMYGEDFGVWARVHGEELMALAASWLEQNAALEQAIKWLDHAEPSFEVDRAKIELKLRLP